MVRRVAALQLPATLILKSVKKRDEDLRLTDFLVDKVRAELTPVVRGVLLADQLELGLRRVGRRAHGGEHAVQLLNRILLDRTDDRERRGVARHVDDQVLLLGHFFRKWKNPETIFFLEFFVGEVTKV